MRLPSVVLMVLAVVFKNLGVDNGRIVFWSSLIMWSWTIKVRWSPCREIYLTKEFFVVATQLLSGVLLGAAAFLPGSLPAGYYIARRGLRRTLFVRCGIFNIPFAVHTLLV